MDLYPLPIYCKPNEFFCIMEKVFSEDEVKKVIQAAEKQAFYAKSRGNGPGGMNKGTVGDGHVVEEVRKSEVLFLDRQNPEVDWIFGRMAWATCQANGDKFEMELYGLEALQFTKYNDQKSHYHYHMDAHQNKAQPYHRKLSMSLLLSDPEEYEGGDFVLLNDGSMNNPTRIRAKKGDIVFFYSHLPHAVEPVTKGVRMSLVSWAAGPKLV